jgi:hypothetical protein
MPCLCAKLFILNIGVNLVLTIEDGTVVADADSFIDLFDARTLALNIGLTLPVDDTEAEVKLRQGYLNLLQRERTLQGSRISAIQTGIFPRSNVMSNCFNIDSDAIPSGVILAQLYATDAITSGTETNGTQTGERLKSFNVVQTTYSETYQDGSSQSTNPSIQGVYNALYPLTKAGFQASPCGNGGGLTRESMGFL